jgi:hypothetical protein
VYQRTADCLSSALQLLCLAESLEADVASLISSDHATGDPFRTRDDTPPEPLRGSIGDTCILDAGAYAPFNNGLAQPYCRPLMTSKF